MKRMVLVPEDAVNRYEQRQKTRNISYHVQHDTQEHANVKHSSTGGYERRSKTKTV